MLRSLLAIIAAVIIGLTAAKFVEGGGAALLTGGDNPLAENQPVSRSYSLILAVGWAVASFTAALTALLLGRRWAALGWLAGACILFSACIAIVTFSLSWYLWPAAVVATGGGALAAFKLVGAKNAYPGTPARKEYFS